MKFIDIFRKMYGLDEVFDENIKLIKQYILSRLQGVSSKFKIREKAL